MSIVAQDCLDDALHGARFVQCAIDIVHRRRPTECSGCQLVAFDESDVEETTSCATVKKSRDSDRLLRVDCVELDLEP